MEVFILRHGHAEPFAKKDSLRPLSPQGEDEVRFTINSQLDELQNLQRIYCSPYLRAQQTAQLALKSLPGVDLIESNFLTPETRPEELASFLSDETSSTDIDSLILVSHQPLVSTLLDFFCGLNASSHRMGTAALAAVELASIAGGAGHLRWLQQAQV